MSTPAHSSTPYQTHSFSCCVVYPFFFQPAAIAGATGVAVSVSAPIPSMRRRRRVGLQPSWTASSRRFGSMSWASTSGGHGRHSSSMSRKHMLLPVAVRGRRRPGRRRRLRWPSGATACPSSRKHRTRRWLAKRPRAPRPSQRPSGRGFRDGHIGTWRYKSTIAASSVPETGWRSLCQLLCGWIWLSAAAAIAPKCRQKAAVRPDEPI